MRSWIAAFLLSLVAPFAAAQDLPDRVGRLADLEGAVSIYRDPEVGWEEAFLNSPLTSENSVWTDPGARAEVQIGASVMRLDETTQLDIWRLDDGVLDARVESGSLALRLRYLQGGERYLLGTPQARFELRADGRYRIDVDPAREESRLTVFSGRAVLDSQGGLVQVSAGRSIVVYGRASEYVTEAARESEFDRWAAARDSEWRDTYARQYVSPYATGYEDLDRYGRWDDDPAYGVLWYPTDVVADWAPYRYGHWAYVRPWGWTWVDDARWGYAPFHYGRWVYVRDRWAWTPGPRVERPTWAPALVAWVGGSGWSASVTSGPSLGWYPLAPWEHYEPWYRAPRNHVDRLNVVVRNQPPRELQGRSDWRSWNREHGATVVNRDTLVNRLPVASSMVRVPPAALRDQPVLQGAQVLPPRSDWVRRRSEAPPAPAPLIRAPSTVAPAPAPQGNPILRPDFSRRPAPPAPVASPENRPPPAAVQRPGSTREDTDRAIRDARERAQRQRQDQERAAREAQQRQQQEQERASRDTQQRQQQERDRAAREAQQRQQQEQERAAREAQQRQQQQQQQQQQEQARESQRQMQQRLRDERDQQLRDAREREQQREQAQRDAQQRAIRESQQQQQRPSPPAQPAERPQLPDRETRGGNREREKDKDKDKEDKR